MHSVRLQMMLLGFAIAGCADVPKRAVISPNALPVNVEGARPGAEANGDRPPARALLAEQRIAAIVERTIQNTPDPNARARVTSTGIAVRTAQHARLHPASERSGHVLGLGKRSETLQLVDSAGGFCAAVSIASRLAVSALHCVRALCESSPHTGMVYPSPTGCRVPYRLPAGGQSVATVVAISETDLIALLDLQVPLRQHGSLCCDDPQARDPVYTVSHADKESWGLTYGRLSREPIALHWAEGNSTRVLVAEISTKSASSGGGLFDIDDNLVGIQIARWSPWSDDFGKAAFIQASQIFSLAGQYCMQAGASACVGLRCVSTKYDIWNFNRI